MSVGAHDPQVRFFEDRAGHRVAYAIHGNGPPLVCTAWWVSHLEDDWGLPGYRQFFEALGRHHTVVRYDRPGAGLSDRHREVVDLDSEVATLSDLVTHLDFERVSVFGLACAGPPSVAYAARNAERVNKLVLFGSYVDGEHVGKAEVRNALQQLVLAHWGMGAVALTDLFAPNLDAAMRERMASSQRRSATAKMSSRLLELIFDVEVVDEASKVSCPTLVVHRRDDRAVPYAAGRELAAVVPDAVWRTLDGAEHVPWFGDVDRASRIVTEFLLEGPVPEAQVPAVDPSSGPSPSATWTREGELWRVRFDDVVVHLPDMRGLADLAVLVASPGQPVHAVELWAGEDAPAQRGLGHDTKVDDRALEAYRKRLEILDDHLEAAKSLGDAARVESILAERERLAHEVRAAVGKGGAKRDLNSVSERARKAVSARIRAALKKISEVHAPLAKHLEDTVKTGTNCIYEPIGDVGWVVETGC